MRTGLIIIATVCFLALSSCGSGGTTAIVVDSNNSNGNTAGNGSSIGIIATNNNRSTNSCSGVSIATGTVLISSRCAKANISELEFEGVAYPVDQISIDPLSGIGLAKSAQLPAEPQPVFSSSALAEAELTSLQDETLAFIAARAPDARFE